MSPDLLPFLVFTTGHGDGQTTDHYYGPTSTDAEARVAVYEPVAGPESALATVWEQGYDAGLIDAHCSGGNIDNPYRSGK
ncbi:hypothetical protein [Arthrobacter bambusae]|uniref:hypothetical protein n=1 Tax=Arthrobacter bambusae TaxID=1338426 RepID=UPI0027837B39|nr:hypothetical protein [Arthrobacter bambusae]MDQ0241195.1 hypothetical protein [Arthrobacter bambusae]